MALKEWKRTEPTVITKAEYREIVSKTFVVNDEQLVFDTFYPEGQEFAGIVALTTDNQVIIARQFRVGPEQIMDELPGGYLDDNETPEESVRRELLEETGYSAGSVEYIGSLHKDSYMNALWHFYFASNCTKTAEQKLDETEDVEVALITIEQLLINARNDKMTDHGGVLLAYDKLKKIQEEIK